MEFNKFFKTVDRAMFAEDTETETTVPTRNITKEMVLSGNGLELSGGLIHTFNKNSVTLEYYGGDLCIIEINGINIEDMFEIPESTHIEDELCYRITDEAMEFVLNLLNEETYATTESKTLIGVAKNNVAVYAGTETIEHMNAHSDVAMDHITKAISKIEIAEGKTFLMQNVDLHTVIGKDHCVSVTSDDDVRMEQRPNRQGKTPMVYGREAEDTSLINIGMCVDDDGLWTLFTAFYGVLAPKEPWDERLKEEEKAESIKFWSTHALVTV